MSYFYAIDNGIYEFDIALETSNYNYPLLNAEQVSFHKANLTASVSEVLNLTLVVNPDVPTTKTPIILNSLVIDGNEGEYYICKINTPQGFEITNIKDEINYTFLIQNTFTDTITIILPTSTDDIKSTNTITISPNNFREIGMVQNLEKKRIWVYSEEMFNS